MADYIIEYFALSEKNQSGKGCMLRVVQLSCIFFLTAFCGLCGAPAVVSGEEVGSRSSAIDDLQKSRGLHSERAFGMDLYI